MVKPLSVTILITILTSAIHTLYKLFTSDKYIELFWIQEDLPAHYVLLCWPLVTFWNIPKKLFIQLSLWHCRGIVLKPSSKLTIYKFITFLSLAVLSALRVVYFEMFYELLRQPWGGNNFTIPDFRLKIIKFLNSKNNGLIGLYWSLDCKEQIPVFRF